MRKILIAGISLVALVGCTSGDDNADGSSGTEPAVSESSSPDVSIALSANPEQPAVSSEGSAGWSSVSVTDGDTLDVSGPDGTWTVRLIGINTPEVGECMADEATAALTFIVTGQELTLVPDTTDFDQYDRRLRYVEYKGVDVGADLVRLGLAISREYAPDTARASIYNQLQADAQAARVGLWAPDACGPASADVSILVDGHFDAEGDDNQNLNDEWVRFTNTSTDSVDLNNWIVADESSTHRYTFGDLVLDPASAVTLYSGCGSDTPTERFWCNNFSAIWNNGGDTVFLRDPSGNNVVVHTYQGD